MILEVTTVNELGKDETFIRDEVVKINQTVIPDGKEFTGPSKFLEVAYLVGFHNFLYKCLLPAHVRVLNSNTGQEIYSRTYQSPT